jgi:periplasmic protein TonB
MTISLRTFCVTASLAVATAFAGAGEIHAQDANRVYTAAEITTPAKLKSPQAAAAAVERTYPSGMRSVGGRVQLQFVVQPNGRVDPASIEVIVASANQLAEAAKRAIQQIEFQPGEVNGVAVRSVVQFPITYAVN